MGGTSEQDGAAGEAGPGQTSACARSIVDTVREPFVILDDHLRLLSANDAFHRSFGSSPQDVEGKSLFALADGRWDIPGLRNRLEAVARGTAPLDDWESVLDLPGRGHKTVLLNARRVGLDGVDRVLLAIEDVTALRTAEAQRRELASRYEAQLQQEREHALQALREREELNRRTLHALPATISVLDAAGRIVAVNMAWMRFATDNGAEESTAVAVGSDYLAACRRAATDDAYARQALEGIEKVLAGRSSHFSLDYPCDSPEQQRWFQMTVVPLGTSGAGAGGAVVTHLDISDRKQAEMALREADRHKDRFLATLAHELRNPLAPICTGLDLLQRQCGAVEHVGQTIRVMDRQLAHLVRLIDDLLDFSRIAQGKIRLRRDRHAVAEIVDATLEMSAHGFGNRRVTVDMPDQPLYVDGDRVRLVQVLANLVNNAVKFTADGGRIAIGVAVRGDRVEFEVRDDGRGIAPDKLDRIFDMYVQDDPDHASGIGIGLSLVRSLVEMHGGTVAAASAGPGRGAVFTVSLPLWHGALPEPAPIESPERPALTQHRVLVVDDNREIADSLRELLTLLQADVRVAYDGAEAIAICETWLPTHVLMDLGMPGIDGFETARRLRARYPQRPFRLIAISGWGREEDRKRAREAGFDQHFVKPVRVEELGSMLSCPPGGVKDPRQ